MRKMRLLCRWIVQPVPEVRSIPIRDSYSVLSLHPFLQLSVHAQHYSPAEYSALS